MQCMILTEGKGMAALQKNMYKIIMTKAILEGKFIITMFPQK